MFKSELKYAPWFAKDKKNGFQTHLTTNIPKWQVNTQTKTLTKAALQALPKTLCKPLKHTNKKGCDEGTNQPITHNKEAFDQREKGYLTYIIKGLRILGANQQNDIITSEYLEEVHHLQYPSHVFTVLTARSEEDKSTEE